MVGEAIYPYNYMYAKQVLCMSQLWKLFTYNVTPDHVEFITQLVSHPLLAQRCRYTVSCDTYVCSCVQNCHNIHGKYTSPFIPERPEAGARVGAKVRTILDSHCVCPHVSIQRRKTLTGSPMHRHDMQLLSLYWVRC